ncbi:hypothetical protein D3C83_335670 [compost metagenome]
MFADRGDDRLEGGAQLAQALHLLGIHNERRVVVIGLDALEACLDLSEFFNHS